MSRLDQLKQARLDKLDKLKSLGVNVSPASFKPLNRIVNCKFDTEVTVAGRVRGYRRQGKVAFIDLQDESGKIQVFASLADMGENAYEVAKLLDVGDFIGVEGTVFKTQAGEKTIRIQVLTFLGKSLEPLPDTWYGLKDKEDRFRKRYLDLLLNPEAKELLDARWNVVKTVREFMWSENYKEVETPILQNLYGGTNAKPFTTHLNALDTKMYLRVAPELYLKRLIIGGYERVFEIARNFRNEGMDQTHQPEFTMMEFYEAYADYHRIMDVTEELVKSVAQKVNGSLKLKMEDHNIDLSGKWRRITVDEIVKEHLGIDWETISDQEIKKLLSEFKVPGVYSRNKALFAIYDHLVTPKLIEPTWVIDYPVEISPLSKTHRSKKGRVERFEGYIGGKEICDGWSEIVSEHEQRDRFESEQKNMQAGDDEAQPLDEEFLEALSYGCPPLGGIGIGIDRLVMFIKNTWAIREVIAFPLLRPETVTSPKQTTSHASIPSHSISQDIKSTFPGMFYAYTVIDGVEIKKSNPKLKKLTTEVIAGNTRELEAIGELKPVKSYRELFKQTGAWKLSRRPSPEALLKRLATGKGIYNVNTAVDAYNLAVIETGVGLGGFNADKLNFPITLRLTHQGETMLLLGDDKPTITLEGEIAYADTDKLVTLDLNYRDIDATKITEDTKKIILYADGAPGLTETEVVGALQKGAKYIREFCGGTIGEIQVVK
ncbi:MAG: lysine--tRNA ligase [bacterium]